MINSLINNGLANDIVARFLFTGEALEAFDSLSEDEQAHVAMTAIRLMMLDERLKVVSPRKVKDDHLLFRVGDYKFRVEVALQEKNMSIQYGFAVIV